MYVVGNIASFDTEPSKRYFFLDNNQRNSICQVFKNSSSHGKLKHGTTKLLASSYSMSLDVIY